MNNTENNNSVTTNTTNNDNVVSSNNINNNTYQNTNFQNENSTGTDNSNVSTTNVSSQSENIAQNPTNSEEMNINNKDSYVNENLKKVEINYTPPSKFKVISMIFMFILIIGFVVFLPEITTMINMYKASKNEDKKEIITTGKLECVLKSNTSNLDIEYLRVFMYTDSKLESADYTITTKGDIDLDAENLSEMNSTCKLLGKYTENLNGIKVKCTLSENKLIEKQSFKFSDINKDEIDSAFAEAGGTYPNYNVGDSIDEIEKNMYAAGYTCNRKQ